MTKKNPPVDWIGILDVLLKEVEKLNLYQKHENIKNLIFHYGETNQDFSYEYLALKLNRLSESLKSKESLESLKVEIIKNRPKDLSTPIDLIIKSIKTIFLDPEKDNKPISLSIHCDPQNPKSQDLAKELWGYYKETFKYKFDITSEEFILDNKQGIKEVLATIKGSFAFGLLKQEEGVTVLNEGKLTKASGIQPKVLVEVFPKETQKLTKFSTEFNEKELEWTYCQASGHGQNINKSNSMVKLKHLPSGLVIACQDQRSQWQNKQIALERLKNKLDEYNCRMNLEFNQKFRVNYSSIKWQNHIRTFLCGSKNMLRDTRTDLEILLSAKHSAENAFLWPMLIRSALI
jgi:peptide chain release factor 2